ncbi:TSUP family transporter [Reinekea blandensis]|uniref:Probable membrane transporter protein n=1 Tax=Reinekea blandensis MED297 TaxID=314283 RepID=A4BKQ3_9GAMM|nr:TSUP family transporter [Reinekea blandensis]EAR07305.1 hypothetical protein MED297_07316 [Reinekea sp. MED297] [Reinekea blandensis MED297]
MTLVLSLLAIALTSALSGILGMGGGFILAGVLALLLPLPAAMFLHAISQFTANGYRAWLQRQHIEWRVVRHYLFGLLLAVSVVALLAVQLNKNWFYLLLGGVALFSQLVPRSLSLDATKPAHAFTAGLLVSALHILVGVAGPLLDLFFQRTSLSRFQIVATKAATQLLGHLMRILLISTLWQGDWLGTAVAGHWFAMAILVALIGTNLGTRLLRLINERQFGHFSRTLLCVLGCLYIGKGLIGLYA